MQTEKAKKLIGSIDIPPLPMIAQKVLETLSDPESSAQDLSKLISQDQVLVGKVLKIANSAFYGLSREVTTLHHSIVILGHHTVRNLVLGISMMGYMNTSKKGGMLNRKKFWMHSLKRAILAKLIAKKVLTDFQEEAFIASLIHDTGKLIFDEYFAGPFYQVLQEMHRKPQEPVCELEQGIIGVDHQEMGAWLMEKWNFPPIYVNATRHHHQPLDLKGKSEHYKITAVVFLSDVMSEFVGSPGGQQKSFSADPQVLSDLGWTPADTDVLSAQSQKEFDQVSMFF